jgi:hypothetical protein
VAVADQLTCLATRSCEAETDDDAVKAALKKTEQVLTRYAVLTACLFVIDAELTLKDSVVTACLLLLTKLNSVLALLLAAAAVISGRICAAIDGALRRKAALTLEEELLAFAAALLALCRCIASH